MARGEELKSARTPYHDIFLQETTLIDPLIRMVLAYVHDELGCIDQAEAEKVREELMAERKQFVTENNENLFEREFSLCEH